MTEVVTNIEYFTKVEQLTMGREVEVLSRLIEGRGESRDLWPIS